LIDVSYSESFQKGTDCSGTAVVTADAPQEDQAADYRNTLIQSISPASHYSIPVSATINAKYALTPNVIFDVAENQGDGTSKNRTFKLVVSPTLEVKNTSGTWINLTLSSKVSNMGAYQYYYKPPFTPNTGPVTVSVTPAVTPMFTTNNTSNVMSANGSLLLANMNGNVSPPPEPNYPNPVPPPVNNLELNKDYRFKVVATLKELVNGNWITATTRTGLTVTETKTYNFRTGPMQAIQGTSVQAAIH